MKLQRKIVATVLAGLLALSGVACSSGAGGGAGGATEGATEAGS